jgi:hypothetical protein
MEFHISMDINIWQDPAPCTLRIHADSENIPIFNGIRPPFRHLPMAGLAV